MKLVLIGFGFVAKSFVRLLERKRAQLKADGIEYSIVGIATGRHGHAVNIDGLDVNEIMDLVEKGASISKTSRQPCENALDVIRHSNASVMFENSPLDVVAGEPAITHARAAFEFGMHVITANKGTVVHAYQSLCDLANSKHRRFLFEATVLGGLPLFNVFRDCMPVAQVLSFKGIINSTTNIILSRMETENESFEQAVKYCQSIGIAEADPSNDVDGWDAAVKVAALVTVLMRTRVKPQQVDRTGIRGITPQMIRDAQQKQQRYKLVASATRAVDGSIRTRVAPELVDATSSLYFLMGASAGLQFSTDVIGDLSLIETEREGLVPGPDPTAFGLLADFVSLHRR